MALVQGTNSYVTYNDAVAYFETRLDSNAWVEATVEDRESAIVTATLMLDENQFIGVAVSSNQSLAWPRKDVTYFEPKLGFQQTVLTTEYPKRLKMATYELTLHLLTNENLLDNTTQTFERIKVGPIEIEDLTKDVTKIPLMPNRVKSFIKPLLVDQGSRLWWRSN